MSVNGGKPIENDLIYGSVEGMKTTEHGDSLAGAVIGLFKKDETNFTKDTALMTTTSAEDGSFSFANRKALDDEYKDKLSKLEADKADLEKKIAELDLRENEVLEAEEALDKKKAEVAKNTEAEIILSIHKGFDL